MNITIIQEAGRHAENKEFRESLCLKRGFEKLGETVQLWGLGYNLKDFDEIEKNTDVFLIIENYTPEWLPFDKIAKSNKLKIYWSIDSHVVLELHKSINKRLNINIHLNSSRSYLSHFKDSSDKTIWFPNAYPSDLIFPKNIEKTIDIGFCGGTSNRGGWIGDLKKYNIVHHNFVIGDSMVNAINTYKLHFNRNVSNDINYRTFETCGCKTILLTNYTDGLEELFKLEEEIITYSDINDLYEKIDFLLENETIRKQIEINGYNNVLSSHTYDKRCEQLIDIINSF